MPGIGNLRFRHQQNYHILLKYLVKMISILLMTRNPENTLRIIILIERTDPYDHGVSLEDYFLNLRSINFDLEALTKYVML